MLLPEADAVAQRGRANDGPASAGPDRTAQSPGHLHGELQHLAAEKNHLQVVSVLPHCLLVLLVLQDLPGGPAGAEGAVAGGRGPASLRRGEQRITVAVNVDEEGAPADVERQIPELELRSVAADGFQHVASVEHHVRPRGLGLLLC